MEESQKADEERLQKLEESMNQKLQDIKDMKQGIATNESPFKEGESSESNGIKLEDPEVVSTIEEESRQKYIEKNKLPDDWGTRQ